MTFVTRTTSALRTIFLPVGLAKGSELLFFKSCFLGVSQTFLKVFPVKLHTQTSQITALFLAILYLFFTPLSATESYRLIGLKTSTNEIVKINTLNASIDVIMTLPFSGGNGFDFNPNDGYIYVSVETSVGTTDFYKIDLENKSATLAKSFSGSNGGSIGFTSNGNVYSYKERAAFTTGTLYFCDWANSSVTSLGSSGTPSMLGGDFDESRGVFWAGDEWNGKIYQLDSRNSGIVWTSSSTWASGNSGDLLDIDITPDGTILACATQGSKPNEFYILKVDTTTGNFNQFITLLNLNSDLKIASTPPVFSLNLNNSAIASFGKISAAGTLFQGSNAKLDATPNSGYRFTGWTGDASGNQNPLTITMDADKTVGATFEKDLTDADNDGLTAFDELVTYNTNPNLADTDGDGINDGDEVQQGRSPSVSEPVITNVVATQRTGTKFFDISFDLASTTPTVKISLEISSDGGATYTVPVTSATGAIGEGVAIGNGKSIVWNAGIDWDAKSSSQMRFRLIADNQIINGLSLIPAGAFTMGRTSGDTDTNAPPVTVNVSRFYMGKYEVTKALWDEVLTWAVANGYTDITSMNGKAPDHPIQAINWFDVVKWCNARSQKEGLTPCYTVSGSVMKTGTTAPTVNWSANGYRLPTEAEWEKAARGGVSGKRFPWGTDTISHLQANFNNSGNESYKSGTTGYHPSYASGAQPYTSPVGVFAPNGYGLYDTAGNVWEWCWDLYGASSYVNGATDPRGSVTGSFRVLRGGGNSLAVYCRTAQRITSTSINDTDIGFRLARSSGVGAVATISTINTNLDTRMWTLTTSSAMNGSVSGAGSYLSQTSANVTATPNSGYLFGSWSGDVSGTSNPTSVLMDANKTVGATFVEDNRDPDSDGLTNYQEIIIRLTNPNLADTDNDGVNDGQEVTDTTNPLVADTDGDGITDGEEKTRTTNPLLVDTDGDGLGDLQEITITQTNPLLSDSNGNGISDALEDTDNDGILNSREIYQLGTNPLLADTNSNGLSDTYELLFQGNTDPFTPRVGDRVRYDISRLGYQGNYKLVGTLPAGLSFNATSGILEGKLTGSAKINNLTIQVLNGKTVVRSIPLSIPVQAFPTSLAGKWQALLENDQGQPEGLVTVTISSPGKWSATYDGIGTRSLRKASGLFDLVAAQEQSAWNMTFPAIVNFTTNTPAVTMSFGVDGNTALASGTHPRGSMRGFRLARSTELPVKTSTITMLIDQGVQDGFVIPAGMGWATGSISNRGSLALAGQLGDAQAFRATLSLGATGQALMWLKPYKNLNSYIGGIVSLHGSGVLPASPLHKQESGLWWYRATDATELSYPGGFAPLSASVGVRSHLVPANAAALSQNLGLVDNVIRGVVFDGGGLPDPNAVAKLPEAFAIDASYKMVALPIPGQPMAPWSGLIASRTGGFTGTLRVVASNSDTIAGNATVSGVLFPTVGSRVVGAGLVKIPIAGPKGAFRTGAIVLGTEEEN